MKNHIERFRAEIQSDFKKSRLNQGETITSHSPSGKYGLTSTNWWSEDRPFNVCMVEIHENGNPLFEFLVNHDTVFYEWLEVNGMEYLICAEDIIGGQSIIDLTAKEIAGFTPGEYGFIWTEFFLSPDASKLATIGCYWGSPYMIKVFDFRLPLTLPLPEIQEIELLDNDEIIIGWLDNNTLKTRGIDRERIQEQGESGGFRWKIISEKEVERNIPVVIF